MLLKGLKFNRLEFAGSLGDFGTLIPLSVALIIFNGLSITAVFLMVGLFYIGTGLYYRLPVPVQPLKVVAAVAIASPLTITPSVIAASGIVFGFVLLLLVITGLIDKLATLFTKPVIRGIQLGLGLILIKKGLDFILKKEVLLEQAGSVFASNGVSLNPVIGIAAGLITLLLITNKRFPAALVVVFLGIIAGILCGSLREVEFALGPMKIDFIKLSLTDFLNATLLLVIPQIPLTIGNAVIGTSDTCVTLFGKNSVTARMSYRSLAISMGLANIASGILSAMPMCHGAGGLAAHHRFGARTGGSNLMIGLIFVTIALLFSTLGLAVLMSIPNGVLGTLLLFAGLELAMLIRDLNDKKSLFVTLLTAGVGFGLTNMGIAFLIGILIDNLIRWKKINL
ncbi:putative sulfate/molybdate transporter [bacterium]|nr:putative sulfate/molybdate transporter [bacterium]